MNIKCLINLAILFVANSEHLVATHAISIYDICPLYNKKGQSLNVQDVVGVWVTVYTQPKPLDCFHFHVRSTMELVNGRYPVRFDSLEIRLCDIPKRRYLFDNVDPAVPIKFCAEKKTTTVLHPKQPEREQYIMKYGDFDGRVEWNLCLLQVESSFGKHFLMGNGSEAGLMENIIIMEKEPGNYTLLDQTADQWAIFGRRGTEVLIIRDCYGDTVAAFARAPYWPTTTELSAIFHRSGITAQTYGRGRLLCEPQCRPTIQQKTRDSHHIKRN